MRARGFDGLYFSEHTHEPVEDTAFAYPDAQDFLQHHKRYHSPLIGMAFAAAVTKNLKVGTCVGLPAQHDPIVLAKALASLDNMSGGRVVYGFGFGWSAAEMADHGVDPSRRRATTRDKMLAIKTLWNEEIPSYSGEFVRFPPCRSWPKPPPGRLPILLGAAGTDQVFQHVIEYCDGWMPAQNGDPTAFLERLHRLRTLAKQAGRDPESLQIEISNHDPSVERYERLRDAGVHRVILHVGWGDIDATRRVLDRYAKELLQRLPLSSPRGLRSAKGG